MNIKDLVVPVGFALVTVFSLNYFYPRSNTAKEEIESSFVAPRERKEYKPLNIEIDFDDQKRIYAKKITDVETDWGLLSFSTDGASLYSMDFKREINGKA